MRLAQALAAAGVLAALAATGCGRAEQARDIEQPAIGLKGTEKQAAADLGFPAFATKNTTRVGGADAVANAAAVARATYPATSAETRPHAVVLTDGRDWRTALAASVLVSAPLRAPILLARGEDLPPATSAALDALRPIGAARAGNAQVIRVGDVPRPQGLRTTDVRGRDPFAVARALDALQAAARGQVSERVLVVSADEPGFAMPAAAWAAKSGDPILFVRRDEVPEDTRKALEAHQKPRIYVLGPSKIISPKVTRVLRRLGTVTRLGGPDPVHNAIAFSRFQDGSFGWGVVDPGHGFVFARADRPLDAAAAAPLSAFGTYGPLLLLDEAARLPAPVEQYLLDVQPGYSRDPVRGVYNHGWIVGDDAAIAVAVQSRIDQRLEIVPVTQNDDTEPPA